MFFKIKQQGKLNTLIKVNLIDIGVSDIGAAKFNEGNYNMSLVANYSAKEYDFALTVCTKAAVQYSTQKNQIKNNHLGIVTLLVF